MTADLSPERQHECSRQLSLGGWVYSLAVIAGLCHFVFSGRYGYFRDELYYAACGEHLAWGYIDHAPLVALIARLSRCPAARGPDYTGRAYLSDVRQFSFDEFL